MLHLFLYDFDCEHNMTVSNNFTKPNTDQCGKSLQMLQDYKNHILNSQHTYTNAIFTESPNVAKRSPNVAFSGNNIK